MISGPCRTDGTGDRALVNTQHSEHLRAMQGLWVLYVKDIRIGTESKLEVWSHNLKTGAQHLHDDSGRTIFMAPYETDRVMFNTEYHLFSDTVTGSDRIDYANVDAGEHSIINRIIITPNAAIYSHEYLQPEKVWSRFLGVPLAGGAATLLSNDSHFYSSIGASIGNRVAYHSCPTSYQPCDIASIDADGTDRVVLASHPANEVVQGVTTDQVIIRRNLSGNDQLIAVPIAGGPETLLMTMADSEFVDLIVGELLIVRRPSGTWSLDLNSTLTKLGTVVGDSGFIAVGDAVCLNKGTAVWCMPLNGQGQAVKIADTGRVIGAL